MKVAFQGTFGAYSEEALNKHFKNEAKSIGLNTSQEVCDAVLAGEVDFGLLPIENSIVGNVNINLDLFFKYDFQVIAEIYLPINHCLLAVPGVTLEEVEKAYSHPVALEQCRKFFEKHKISTIPDYDTAGSAQNLSKRKSKGEASVASSLCAEYYDLEVIKTDIQQVKTNITRFFVFVSKENVPADIEMNKTSVIFSTKHSPGALLKCLQLFAKHGINLTKIESRPIPENPFEYVFYTDFLGSIGSDNVIRCLSEIKDNTDILKILGSYPQGTRSN